MGWMALISTILTFLIELIKIIREVRSDKKSEREETKKKQTEAIQSGVRGIIDGDKARVVTAFDSLRRMRQK